MNSVGEKALRSIRILHAISLTKISGFSVVGTVPIIPSLEVAKGETRFQYDKVNTLL